MKRILSIDGGGIRGLFSLQVLARIEALCREKRGRDDLVLADEFDLFAGTSTGAIIACCLSWGMTVKEIEDLYLLHGREMFSPMPWHRRLRAKYRADRMAATFRRLFVEEDGTPADLGSSRLRTMLLVVMRNATTGSPWPITNNPNAKYNQTDSDQCNLRIPLWQLLRASTAAPTYFSPEAIELGGRSFLFVDGGVTPYNNPALLAAMTATLPSYRMDWQPGPDRLHLVSVGTGSTRGVFTGTSPDKINIFRQLSVVPAALVGSVADQQDLMCRVLGRCVHGPVIDREIGDLIEASAVPRDEPMFTYARYTRRLDIVDEGSSMPPLRLAQMDNLAAIPQLQALGIEYAKAHVRPEHLEPVSSRIPGNAPTQAADTAQTG
ncbi:MAG: patatin-like phospholipase family protein [Planctomycetota bacterium]